MSDLAPAIEKLTHTIAQFTNSLSGKAPIFFSASKNPFRALVVRETSFHRVTELADSACHALKKSNFVSAALLIRAALETVALFIDFLNKVESAIYKQDLQTISTDLDKMLAGGKDKNANFSCESINILSTINNVNKQIPTFRAYYDLLSEIAHPNAAGLNHAYARIHQEDRKVIFGKAQGSFAKYGDALTQTLITTLHLFEEKYNYSATVLREFETICDSASMK